MTNDSVVLAATAALLERGRDLDRLSRLFTAVALAGAIAIPVLAANQPVLLTLLVLALAAGMAQAFLAVRVGFDAALFRALAEESRGHDPVFAALDDAFRRMNMLRPEKAGRPLEPRIAGALRLFHLQGIALVAQFGLMISGIVAARLG
jgi:hypothetical protein